MSTPCQIRVRAPGIPVGRPSMAVELAKATVRAGPARFATSHCSTPSRPGNRSTLTCSDAVSRIIRRPLGPSRSNSACIARYRGDGVRSGTSAQEWYGLVPTASSRIPRCPATATACANNRSRWTMRPATVRRGAGLSSNWPPGSNEGRAAATKAASKASRAGSTGIGGSVLVTGISSTSTPTRPGRCAGANARLTASESSMGRRSPTPSAGTSVPTLKLVLNAVRRHPRRPRNTDRCDERVSVTSGSL
jgi:hypothetical protein